MARTRSQDYDIIKATILNKAADLFAAKGFADTSIMEISEASGLSKSGIYHYFTSKQQILSTLLTEHVETIFDTIGVALQSSQDPVGQLRVLTTLLLEDYSRSKSRHSVLMSELGSLADADREKIVSLERRVVKFTEGIIEKIKPGLSENPINRRPVVMLFFGMINWTYTWYNAEKGMQPEHLARIAANIFINGLTATDFS